MWLSIKRSELGTVIDFGWVWRVNHVDKALAIGDSAEVEVVVGERTCELVVVEQGLED